MTQPTLPTADAQKQAAVAVFAQYEPPLYEAYLDMMVEWLAAVKAAMFAGGVATLGLVPDPMTVFSQGPKWAGLVSQYTDQVAREVLAAPYKDLFADGTLFESRPFVRNWIAERENRLNAVPNEVFGLVSQIVDSATTNGASIPDVTAQVEQLFADSGMQTWKNRARTVARTEVVGAYNGGLNDAFSMIVAAGDEDSWVKRWLATEDHRTRPDHREADGQVVPFSQPFDVGGFQMMHPHDPQGPPQEVINCRCTMLLEIENEPTRMDNRQYKDASLVAGFNPAEKRDHDGKWTKGGGLLKGLLKKAEKAPPPKVEPPKESPRPEPVRRNPLGSITREEAPAAGPRDGLTGPQALAQFPPASKATEDQKMSLGMYSDDSTRTNQTLAGMGVGDSLDKADAADPGHRGKPQPGVMPKVIGTIDGYMRPSTKAVTVFRGIKNLADAFGDLAHGDMAGVEFTQKGYASTSTDFLWGLTFAGKSGATMRVHVPAGIKGIRMDLHKDDEQEALLQRGLRFRVTGDSKDEHGNRILDVEVIGHG